MPDANSLPDLPEKLAKTLAAARFDVGRALLGQTDELRRNATRVLGPHLLYLTAPDRLVEDQIAQAMMRMFDLAEAVDRYQRSRDSNEIKKAEAFALAALDDLHRALLFAKPGDAISACEKAER